MEKIPENITLKLGNKVISYKVTVYVWHDIISFQISRGYHETVTMFYITMLAEAIKRCDSPEMTFEEFIAKNDYLKDKGLLFQYYTDEAINKKEAYET